MSDEMPIVADPTPEVRLTDAEREAISGAFDDGGSVVWLALQSAVERIVAERLAAVEAAIRALPITRTRAWDRGWDSVSLNDVLAALSGADHA